MRLLYLLALCLCLTACAVNIRTSVDEGAGEVLEYEETLEEVLPPEDK